MSRKLTSSSTLDNLKKEARRWLKARRENITLAGTKVFSPHVRVYYST